MKNGFSFVVVRIPLNSIIFVGTVGAQNCYSTTKSNGKFSRTMARCVCVCVCVCGRRYGISPVTMKSLASQLTLSGHICLKGGTVQICSYYTVHTNSLDSCIEEYSYISHTNTHTMLTNLQINVEFV